MRQYYPYCGAQLPHRAGCGLRKDYRFDVILAVRKTVPGSCTPPPWDLGITPGQLGKFLHYLAKGKKQALERHARGPAL
jgi:hypothetical protein